MVKMFSAVDVEQDWPQLPTYSKGYLKREKMLKEKTLVDVKKRVKQTERMIKPAVENATAASSTAKQAEESANAVAKVRYAEVHVKIILFSKSLNDKTCQ